MGEILEGQRPSIMDPSLQVAPTAVKPMAGFKGADGNEKKKDNKNAFVPLDGQE